MQPVLHFVVNNQIIARTDTFVPVRNSRNYLYAEFEFQTEDWAGKSKTALEMIAEIKEENNMLKECLLEMSELVYQ